VLACRKCQKKLKRSSQGNGIAKLSKLFKQRARQDEDGLKVRVLQVSCLKLCPKGGVTVCTQGQLGRNLCSIVSTPADAAALYEQCKAQHSIAPARARPKFSTAR
jgi:hypothetical protein